MGARTSGMQIIGARRPRITRPGIPLALQAAFLCEEPVILNVDGRGEITALLYERTERDVDNFARRDERGRVEVIATYRSMHTYNPSRGVLVFPMDESRTMSSGEEYESLMRKLGKAGI
jgi:hypothetical protein